MHKDRLAELEVRLRAARQEIGVVRSILGMQGEESLDTIADMLVSASIEMGRAQTALREITES